MKEGEKNFDRLGFPIEEYEIQFIDGERHRCALFEALKINQANFGKIFHSLPGMG